MDKFLCCFGWKLCIFTILFSQVFGEEPCVSRWCQSRRGDYKTCQVNALPEDAAIINIRVLEQRSGSTGCVFQESYGFTERDIWVDLGCRASFNVCYRNVSDIYSTTFPSSPPDNSTSSLVPSARSNDSSNTGGIIAGVLCAIVLAVAVIVSGLIISRRYNIKVPCIDKIPLPRDLKVNSCFGRRRGHEDINSPLDEADQTSTYNDLTSNRDSHIYKEMTNQSSYHTPADPNRDRSYMTVYNPVEGENHVVSDNGISNGAYEDVRKRTLIRKTDNISSENVLSDNYSIAQSLTNSQDSNIRQSHDVDHHVIEYANINMTNRNDDILLESNEVYDLAKPIPKD